jgi:hypothetical protein
MSKEPFGASSRWSKATEMSRHDAIGGVFIAVFSVAFAVWFVGLVAQLLGEVAP